MTKNRFRLDTGGIIENKTGAIFSDVQIKNTLNKQHNEILNLKYHNDELQEQLMFIETVIKSAVENERTDLGRNVLVQLADSLGIDVE